MDALREQIPPFHVEKLCIFTTRVSSSLKWQFYEDGFDLFCVLFILNAEVHLLFIHIWSSLYTLLRTFLKYFIASGEGNLTKFFRKFENNEPNKKMLPVSSASTHGKCTGIFPEISLTVRARNIKIWDLQKQHPDLWKDRGF